MKVTKRDLELQRILGISIGGYGLSQPAYVKQVLQEDAQPIPFPVSYTIQLSLFGEAPIAPTKNSRKKKKAA